MKVKVIVAFLLAMMVMGRGYAKSRVNVEVDLDKPIVLAGEDKTVVIKVGLSGIDDAVLTRLPVNLAIVLDKSGSMSSGRKIENAKLAAIEVIERLSSEDVVSFIVYDDEPRVIVPAQKLTNKDIFINAIRSISANGSTALYGGVTYGANQVREYAGADYINRIILLSDGLANVGPQSTQELAALGRSLGCEGISVSTVGLGLDYNEDLMTQLASKSSGNSYFAANSDELPKIFAEEIGEAMTLVASKVKVHLQCLHDAQPTTIIGREGKISLQSAEVYIDHIYGKNEKYALLEVDVPKVGTGKTISLAKIKVEYFDPYTQRTKNIEKTITLRYDCDRELVNRSLNKQVTREVALTIASETKEKAISYADKGDYKNSAKILDYQAVQLEKAAKQCDNDKKLLDEAANCRHISKDITQNRGMTRYQRKQVMNEYHVQTTQQSFISTR